MYNRIKKYRTNPNIVLRKIHDIFYLIDIKANYYNDQCFLYEINEVGVFIWKHINEAQGIQDLARLLKQQITDDIGINILVEDIGEFVQVLYGEGFLIDTEEEAQDGRVE